MTKIFGRKVVSYTDMEDSPMFSRSEKDDVIVSFKWDFELPKDHKLFKDIPTMGDFIPVVGVEDNGDEIILGYSCPVFYLYDGYTFTTYEDFEKSYPHDYPRIVRQQDVEKVLEEMGDEEYYD